MTTKPDLEWARAHIPGFAREADRAEASQRDSDECFAEYGLVRGWDIDKQRQAQESGHPDPECPLRLAIEGHVECEHGYDVCPTCDPCTCTGREQNRREMERRASKEKKG